MKIDLKKPRSLNRLLFISILIISISIATAVTIVVTYLCYSAQNNTTSIDYFILASSTQLAAFIFLILLLSLVISSILTEIITRPFKDIDIDNPLENEIYEEVEPLLIKVQEQKEMLKQQNELLSKTDAIRREFTGNVSHEMKTPLQVISGYAELMENSLIPEKDISKNAKLIRKEAESMKNLIDDVLTLSKLDENASKKREAIDLAQTVNNVAKRLDHKAKKNNISVHVDSCEGAIVKGDPILADQLIYNLIDNAIKYNSNNGRVDVLIKKDSSYIQLEVSDLGPGIPDDQKERIFERFYRVDESRSRETGGTGLGLAIVKHSVESLNATITVEDNQKANLGTTFIVRIPQFNKRTPNRIVKINSKKCL